MSQVLSGPIGAGAIVGSAGLGAGAGGARTRGRLERTADTAFGTAHPRDLATFGDRSYDVAALLLTLGAELIDAIADSIDGLFRLWLFSWHENKRGVRGYLPQHARAPPANKTRLNFDWSAAENAALQKDELL